MIRAKKRERIIFVSKLSIIMVFLALFLFVICSNFEVKTYKTYDLSKNRSLRAVNLLYVYKNKNVDVKEVKNVNEVVKVASRQPVVFTGKMTGYGPDCKGCGGNLACPPRHNAKNGNIYHNDKTYGKLRILAADKKFPCGTVVRVSGLKGYKDFYAIILDRGGAIKGELMDLLFASEKDVNIGRNNVTYTIVRWGWNA